MTCIKLYFVVKIPKFRSKYNSSEIYDWSVMHVMSLDALLLLLACKRLDIDLSVKPAS